MFGLRFSDKSGRIVLLANVLALIIALYLGYDIAMMIWLYWLESLAIGVLTLIAIVASLGDKEAKGRKLAFPLIAFFAFNYAVFHMAYAIAANYFPSLAFDLVRAYDLVPAAVLLMVAQAASFYESGFCRKHKNTAVYVAAHVGEVYGRVLYIAMIMLAAVIVVSYLGGERSVLFGAMLLKLLADMRLEEAKKKKLAGS